MKTNPGYLVRFLILSVLIMFNVSTKANTLLKVGQQAPDFTLIDQHNQARTLSEMRGKWLVLYFYPKNETPGCVAEACSFRDNIVAIKAKNTAVWGVSVDNSESNAEFSKNHQLPFTLLADKEGKVAAKYNALRNLIVFKIAKRNSFIINPEGKIVKIYRSVNPKTHISEILKDLKSLQS